jgi:Tol biopolymer transport system component
MIFGIGGTGLQSISNYRPAIVAKTSAIEQEIKNAISTFTVKVTNTDTTRPRFLPDEFTDIIISRDTMLEFAVKSGKIVFTKIDTVFQRTFIYRMDLDGSNVTQLLLPSEILDTVQGIPRPKGLGSEPSWSPDGKKIIYSESLGPDESHIVMMNENGSYKKNLTPVGGYCIRPRWSPQGDRLLYLRGTNLGAIISVSIVDTIGNSFDIKLSPESRVFGGDSVYYDISMVQWHADGKSLYVWGSVGVQPIITGVKGDIFLMNISTGQVFQRLTFSKVIDEKELEINPKVTSIIFSRGPYTSERRIFLMNLTDSLATPISTGISDGLPRWSNDGKLVIFIKIENIFDPIFSTRIYLVNPNMPLKERRVSPLEASDASIFIYANP